MESVFEKLCLRLPFLPTEYVCRVGQCEKKSVFKQNGIRIALHYFTMLNFSLLAHARVIFCSFPFYLMKAGDGQPNYCTKHNQFLNTAFYRLYVFIHIFQTQTAKFKFCSLIILCQIRYYYSPTTTTTIFIFSIFNYLQLDWLVGSQCQSWQAFVYSSVSMHVCLWYIM